jgi:hypothetical protein
MARSTFWVDTIDETVVTSAGSAIIDLTTALGVSDIRGLTLIRMIYKVIFYPVSPADTFTIQGLHMGVAVVENTALAAAAVPNAGIAGDAPGRGWVVRDQDLTQSLAGAAGTFAFGRMTGDIHAMRKFYQDTSLAMIFRSDIEIGTAQSLNVWSLIRCLFKQQ